MTRYDLLYTLALPATIPYLAWRRIRRGKYTESARGMRGKNLPRGAAARAFEHGSLWLHAVSVGEITSARAIAPGLRALLSGLPLVVSTITETGQAAARKAFPDDTVTYYPLDLSRIVRQFQDTFRPRVFVMLETEIWPNFLMLAARRGARGFMVNARLSDRSFPRYRAFQGLLRPAFDALAGLCAQTELDAERFATLGIDPRRIHVTGNCKFDVAYPTLAESERIELARSFGMNPARRWIVAGSTHPAEEALVLNSLRETLESIPDAGLLLCPRHPDRFADAERQTREAGFRTARASAPAAGADPEVVVLDKMGVLARAYGLGELAIVAGSFCPVGGHNLMEAAAHGIPVVFGPDMHSQREIDRIFKQAGAGLQVRPRELAPTLIRLLRDDDLRRAEGRKALQAVQSSRGSAARAVDTIAAWLRNP